MHNSTNHRTFEDHETLYCDDDAVDEGDDKSTRIEVVEILFSLHLLGKLISWLLFMAYEAAMKVGSPLTKIAR